MPQIGWFEILIIVGLAIIVIGPKDFPIVFKKRRFESFNGRQSSFNI